MTRYYPVHYVFPRVKEWSLEKDEDMLRSAKSYFQNSTKLSVTRVPARVQGNVPI